MDDESGQEVSTGAVLPTRALIVRALVGRFNAGESKRTQKASVILKIGDIVKHLPFSEIIGGKAAWNKDAVFIESALDSEQSTLELSFVKLSSAFRSKPPSIPPTLINYRAFADVSSGDQAGWFPVGTDDIKLAFMWKELNSEEVYGISSSKQETTSPRQYLFPTRSTDHSKSPGVGRRVLGLGDIIYSLDEDARNFGVACSRTFLQVTIKSARGLRAVNFGGKSDPFVIIAIHGSRKKTKVLKNTLNPTWPSEESTFRFGDMEDLDEDDEISFTVKDWDPLGRYKDLGQAVLTLRDIDAMSQTQGSLDDIWLNLQSTLYMPEKLNASDLGALQVSFSYALAPKINVSLVAALSPTTQSPTTPTASLPAGQLSPSVSSGVATPNTRMVSIHENSTKVEKPKLYVRVIQARNLFVSDFGGVSDPYAVLKVRSEKRKTPTRFKTLTPVYDFETVFGEHDYLSENDQLVITFFDQDSAISDIVDDELGSCTIPLWSLLADETVSMASALATPRWYSLEPADSKQKCCGEVQLAMYYTNPALKKKDIYKGKVWLFELQATVITARNLATMSADPHSRIKPYCTVSCGSKDRWRTNVATNGVNPTWSERFRFRHSADRDAEREGIQRTDTLRVSVFNSTGGECLGQTVLDVAYIMERLGYVDPQGKAFTDWFDLEPVASADGKHMQDNDLIDEEGGDTDGDEDTESSTLGDTASNASSRKLGLLSTVFKRRGVSAPPAFARSSSGPRSAPSSDIDKPASPLVPVTPEKAPSSPLVLQTSERLRPRGQLRMTIRLLPIGETRVRTNKKLAVYLDEFTATTESSDSQKLPGLVYAKCRVGFDFKSTPPVPLYRTPLKSAVARLHGMLLFEEEVDWLLQEAARRKALEEKNRRRTKHLSASQNQNTSTVVQDAIWISIHNASDDSLLAEVSTSLMDTVLGVPSLERTDVNISTTTKGIVGKLGLQLKLVDVKEEMVPLLGHIFAKPLFYKSLLAPRFDHAMRVVLRYGEKVIASKPIVGDPYPSLVDVFDREIIRFPVFNSFRPLVIEIWQSDRSGEAGESRSARKLARSLLSVFKRSSSDGSVGGREDGRGSRSSRWGTMIASSTLNIFDIIEVEAQTLFEEEGLTTRVPEEGFKLRVRDKSGNAIGSIWIQTHYKENIGGLLSPNPNPPLQPQKPFSLANFRHEVNRLIKIAGWLSGFGAHVGSLLNWDSPPRTVSTIVIIFVLCSVDWFSSRWLMVFPFCVLVHMVNRHRQRSNGMLLTEFEETGEGEEAASAEVRVACLSASPDANGTKQPWRKVHAQVSLLARPGKQAKVIGTTRVDSRIEDNMVDFVSSKLGYSVRHSAKTRPALQMWKYLESLPPVPSFSFRAENFTVPKETILIVTLFSARNLMAADANGFSDPFAKIFIRDAVTGAVAGDVIRSVIRPKTLNPIWNERFVLGEKKAVSSSSILVLNFYDSDVVSTSNDPLGNLEIDLSQLAEVFPVPNNSDQSLSPEERALKGRRWFPLTPPKGYKSKTDFGEVCLFVEWMEVERRVHKASRTKNPNAMFPDSETAAADDFEEEASVESWVHCGAQVAVDLYDQRDIFIGRARFPLGSIVLNDETRAQPQAQLTLPLYPRFDGTKDDARLPDNGIKLGDIVVRTMITLPDPKAKERRMAMLEAKRADRSNPFQKMRMITKHLERIQGQLMAVNARAERTKNLFNWTHPRRTKIMFNLMTVLFILFTIIPSRFFILMVVLFFFTEKFRPMGTMGARFKHLLSHIPTDDDIRAVVNGDAAGGKRKLFNPKGLPVEQKVAPSTPANANSVRRTGQFNAEEGFSTLSKKAQLALLQNVCAGDALFSGSLSYCKLAKGSTKAGDFTRRFFVLSSMGLHFWADHEAMEDSKPLGHYTGLRNVTDSFNVEVPGSIRTDCFFVIESMDECVLFYASSSRKKRAWIAAIREHVLLS